MGTPLSRKQNRHAIRRTQLPQRPPPDTEAERAEKERLIKQYLEQQKPPSGAAKE